MFVRQPLQKFFYRNHSTKEIALQKQIITTRKLVLTKLIHASIRIRNKHFLHSVFYKSKAITILVHLPLLKQESDTFEQVYLLL